MAIVWRNSRSCVDGGDEPTLYLHHRDVRSINIPYIMQFNLKNGVNQLKKLELYGLYKLTEIQPDIGQMNSLTSLTIVICPCLESLPNIIGTMPLNNIILKDCGIRRLPDTICAIATLRVLTIAACRKLTVLPEQIGMLQLDDLRVMHHSVSELPASLRMLPASTFIYIETHNIAALRAKWCLAPWRARTHAMERSKFHTFCYTVLLCGARMELQIPPEIWENVFIFLYPWRDWNN